MGNCICRAGESENEDDEVFQEPSPRPLRPPQPQRQQRISIISNNYHQAYEVARVGPSTQQNNANLNPRKPVKTRQNPSNLSHQNPSIFSQQNPSIFSLQNQNQNHRQDYLERKERNEIRKLEVNSQNFQNLAGTSSNIIRPGHSQNHDHNHVAEFKFWSYAFSLIDKSQDPKKQKEFSLLDEFNREVERNSKMARKGFEKLGFLDWGNIRGFGIRGRDKENGTKIKGAGTGLYVKAIRKISRLIAKAFEYLKISPWMTLNNLKELIRLADQVVLHRKGQLNPQSLTYANHKNIQSEWESMRDALRKVYFTKMYRNEGQN